MAKASLRHAPCGVALRAIVVSGVGLAVGGRLLPVRDTSTTLPSGPV